MKITVRSGEDYDYIKPHPDTIDLEDIARSLARQVRFNGHTEEFYTVAQHSLVAAMLLPVDMAIIGLMHDAAEAFLADLPSDLKKLIDSNGVVDDYGYYETICQEAIYKKFAIRPPTKDELIKLNHVDSATGIAEAELFFREVPSWVAPRRVQLNDWPLYRITMINTQMVADDLNPIEEGFHVLEAAFLAAFYGYIAIRINRG